MSSPKLSRFGPKLKQLRKRAGMNQAQLAEALGFSAANSYISELENGKKIPTAETVLEVARFFKVSTDVLLMDELELPSENDM